MGLASRLWLPPSISRNADTAKVRKCEVCGTTFPWDQRDQAFRHILACADRFDDEIQADAARIENEPMNQYDREAWNWGRERAAQGKRGFKGGRPT